MALPAGVGALVPRSFYERDALEVARETVGLFLVRDEVVLRVTEVEAYLPGDSACHARFGVTQRNAVMWGPGGHAYVYLCYGLHFLLNFVTDRAGSASAVLIRACEPVAGLEIIQARRGGKSGPVLLTGPGKVSAALAIDTSWSGHALFEPGGLEVREGPRPKTLRVGPRVGVDYAAPRDRDALWRFAMPDTPWVSVPGTLRRERAGRARSRSGLPR